MDIFIHARHTRSHRGVSAQPHPSIVATTFCFRTCTECVLLLGCVYDQLRNQYDLTHCSDTVLFVASQTFVYCLYKARSAVGKEKTNFPFVTSLHQLAHNVEIFLK